MSEESILRCDICGTEQMRYAGKEEPLNDPMGRIIYKYECRFHHITKRVKWGRQSINNLYLRIAKLEKALQEKT